MAGELDRARQLRDELYHLRVLTRELRNRTQTLARAYNDSCERVDGLIADLEAENTTHPMEGSGDRNDDRRTEGQVAAAR